MIEVDGKSRFVGYLVNGKIVKHKGWFVTGDRGELMKGKYLKVLGRVDNMFISGGENVYPAEVENVIYQHSAVAEVAVIGIPHPKWQEVGMAVVVPKENAELTSAEIIDFCQDKLARYKIPKSVVFVDELPRTAAGKVLKRDLKEHYSAAEGGR